MLVPQNTRTQKLHRLVYVFWSDYCRKLGWKCRPYSPDLMCRHYSSYHTGRHTRHFTGDTCTGIQLVWFWTRGSTSCLCDRCIWKNWPELKDWTSLQQSRGKGQRGIARRCTSNVKGVKDWFLSRLIHQKKIQKPRGSSESYDFSDLLNLSDKSDIIIFFLSWSTVG